MTQLGRLFRGPTTEWWEQTSRYRTHFQMHARAEEIIEIYVKGSYDVMDKKGMK